MRIRKKRLLYLFQIASLSISLLRLFKSLIGISAVEEEKKKELMLKLSNCCLKDRSANFMERWNIQKEKEISSCLKKHANKMKEQSLSAQM